MITAPALLEWGVAVRALDDAPACGDHALVTAFTHGALLAVVDGLGHGPEASLAAETAVMILDELAGRPVRELIQACHEALKLSRGAVLTVVSIHDNDTLAWSGVGNVEARLIRAAGGPVGALLLRPGVVGYRLPPLREQELPLCPGDTLVLVTDGIAHDFLRDPPPPCTPQELADSILASHGKGTDDALVLVARYRGGAS